MQALAGTKTALQSQPVLITIRAIEQVDLPPSIKASLERSHKEIS